MRRTRAAMALAALATAAAAVGGGGGASAASAKAYAPPYKLGPSGGDSFNVMHNDPTTGRIAVARAYPIPAGISCGGASAYQQQRIRHKVTTRVKKVTVTYDEAVADSYTFLTLLVRTEGGRFLGSARVRGPLLDTGALAAAVNGRSLKKGSVIVIDFGLSVSSACPSADGGTVHLPRVAVS